MKTTIQLSLATIAILALVGCESMTVTECKVADWSRVGASDGARGDSERRIADYTEDCGKAGITPDARAYQRGWDRGIVLFCTPENGWKAGVAGYSSKAAVCQGQAGYDRFAYSLDAGLRVYRLNERIQRNVNELARLQGRLETSKNDNEKKDIRADMRSIDREQYRLREELADQQGRRP